MPEEKMIRGRTIVHTTAGKFYGEYIETPASDLSAVRKIMDSGEIWKAHRMTLDTVNGPLYLNPAHIVAIEFKEV